MLFYQGRQLKYSKEVDVVSNTQFFRATMGIYTFIKFIFFYGRESIFYSIVLALLFLCVRIIRIHPSTTRAYFFFYTGGKHQIEYRKEKRRIEFGVS